MHRPRKPHPFLQPFHAHAFKPSLPLPCQLPDILDKGVVVAYFLFEDFPLFVSAATLLGCESKAITDNDFRALREAGDEGEGVDDTTEEERVGIGTDGAGGEDDGEAVGEAGGGREGGALMLGGWGAVGCPFCLDKGDSCLPLLC